MVLVCSGCSWILSWCRPKQNDHPDQTPETIPRRCHHFLISIRYHCIPIHTMTISLDLAKLSSLKILSSSRNKHYSILKKRKIMNKIKFIPIDLFFAYNKATVKYRIIATIFFNFQKIICCLVPTICSLLGSTDRKQKKETLSPLNIT